MNNSLKDSDIFFINVILMFSYINSRSPHYVGTDGYFACSIKEAYPETIRKYIENQG